MNFPSDSTDADEIVKNFTDEERRAIADLANATTCQCGHQRMNHHRYIRGLLVGCGIAGCKCDHFQHCPSCEPSQDSQGV
jgi:hypothetical protein